MSFVLKKADNKTLSTLSLKVNYHITEGAMKRKTLPKERKKLTKPDEWANDYGNKINSIISYYHPGKNPSKRKNALHLMSESEKTLWWFNCLDETDVFIPLVLVMPLQKQYEEDLQDNTMYPLKQS